MAHGCGLPDRLAFEALHGGQADLAAFAPLDHALQRFESVEAVDIQTAATNDACIGLEGNGSRAAKGLGEPHE